MIYGAIVKFWAGLKGKPERISTKSDMMAQNL